MKRGLKKLVYCTKCGTKNEDNSESCVNCKAPLMATHFSKHERRRKESECFGLPNGGAVFGIIIGAIVILWGLSSILDIDFGSYLWPIAIIIFGLLMVVGALYSFRKKN